MSGQKRVLITGISGFTGRYLEDLLLSQGHQVWGTTSVAESSKPQHVTLDLADQAGLSHLVQQIQPEWVVHLAAIAHVAHSNADAFYQVNTLGTRHLLEALASLKQAPEAVVLASSANIYGNASVEQLDELQAAMPANDYAVSKFAMELMAGLWHKRLPLIVVRPFNYTGRGQSTQFLIPKIVCHFSQRASVLELGNLNVARDFSDVREVVQVYAELLKRGQAGQTYNVCSGNATSLQEILDICAELSGHRPEIRVNPAFVRENEVYKLAGVKQKLLDHIGLAPSLPLRDTLAWMLSEQVAA